MADLPNTNTVTSMTSQELLAAYEAGRRDFSRLEFKNYLELSDCELDDIDFSSCWMDGRFRNVSFRNAKFFDACIKTCFFIDCDLTFANFKNAAIDAIEFENVLVTHACFDGASAYSSRVKPGELAVGLTR
jgi:uncharacterized protein YjbI with pentapeptide repeats